MVITEIKQAEKMEMSWPPLSSLDSSFPSFPTTEMSIDMEHYNHSHDGNYTGHYDIISHPAVQAIFYLVYATIFVLGIFGNVLVCYVVGRNKAMQTVTNFFITNLALSDILLCALAVPFTPLYTFLGEWIFGRILCHLVPYAQGTSVYISTLTLTSIAIDRFFVIIYPFKPRMKLITCLAIITGIWVFALLATLPYGIFLQYNEFEDRYTCIESWPSEEFRQVFSGCTATLQFILPFIIMLFCYIKVSLKLSDRVRAKPGSKNSKKEALERERKRRTNRMLIAMVFIFGMSWLPLNVFNFLSDISTVAEQWQYSNLCFFFAHAVAMSSTCYNPFLYAWLNENFRKEFKQVLPCFQASTQGSSGNRSKRFLSQRTNCNGAETVQESLMPTTSQIALNNANTAAGSRSQNAHSNVGNTTVVQVLETIEELNSSSQVAPSVDVRQCSASFNADTNEVIVHFPTPSFSSTSSSANNPPSTATAAAAGSPGQSNNNKSCRNNNNQETSTSDLPEATAFTSESRNNNGASTVSDKNKDSVVNNKDNGSATTTSTTVGGNSGAEAISINEKSTSPSDQQPFEDDNADLSCTTNATTSDMINLKTFNVNTSVLI